MRKNILLRLLFFSLFSTGSLLAQDTANTAVDTAPSVENLKIENLKDILPNPIDVNNDKLLESLTSQSDINNPIQSYSSDNNNELSGTQASYIVDDKCSSMSNLQSQVYSEECKLPSQSQKENDVFYQKTSSMADNLKNMDADATSLGSGLPDDNP